MDGMKGRYFVSECTALGRRILLLNGADAVGRGGTCSLCCTEFIACCSVNEVCSVHRKLFRI